MRGYRHGTGCGSLFERRSETIGGIEYGSDEELVKAVYEQYGGTITETDDGRRIYYIPESGTGQYRIDVGPEGFAQYFEVYCWDPSELYSYGVGEEGGYAELESTPQPTEALVATPEPTATPIPDDLVIDWNDSALEEYMRYATSIFDRGITYGDVKDITELYLGLGEGEDSQTIQDISALSYLPNLVILDLENNIISDISVLGELTNLEWLYLNGNRISDISVLSNLTKLEVLHASGNQISDISALSGLTELRYLNLNGNDFSDISALSGLYNLEWLTLAGEKISDVSPLENLTKLEYLYIYGNPIIDYSPVSHVAEVVY